MADILYKNQFYDYNGLQCTVNIHQVGYSGAATEVDGGPAPCVITMLGEGDDKFTHIKATECKLELVSSTSLQYLALFLATNKSYRVTVFRGAEPIWQGWINPEYYTEPLQSPPYVTCLTATDGLAELKNVPLPAPAYVIASLKQTFIYYIATCLREIGLSTSMTIKVAIDLDINTTADGIVRSRILEYLYLDYRSLQDSEGNPWNCYEVLDEILSILNARLYQYSDSWHIERIDQKHTTYDIEVYAMDGSYSSTVSGFDAVVALTAHVGAGTDIRFQNTPAMLEVQPAYKGFTIAHNYGNRRNLLAGMSYELLKDNDWTNSTTLRFWNKQGTINYIREEEMNAVRILGNIPSSYPGEVAEYVYSDTVEMTSEGVGSLTNLMNAWHDGYITLVIEYETRKQFAGKLGSDEFLSYCVLEGDFSGTVYRAKEDNSIGENVAVWDSSYDGYFMRQTKRTNDWIAVSFEITGPPDEEDGNTQTSLDFTVRLYQAATDFTPDDDTDGMLFRNIRLYFKICEDDDYARTVETTISENNILEPVNYEVKHGSSPVKPFPYGTDAYGGGDGVIWKSVIYDSGGDVVNAWGYSDTAGVRSSLIDNIVKEDLERCYRRPQFKLRGSLIDTTYSAVNLGVGFNTILKDYDSRYYFPTGLSYNMKEAVHGGEWMQMWDDASGEFNDDFSDDFFT